MTLSARLQRIQRGLSTVELIHTSHPRWPLPAGPFTAPTLQISVLDSSFNPPTLAHLALANIRPPHRPGFPLATHSTDFDARLLLLSVRNVDKQIKSGDATYEQRMEMMILLAQDLANSRTRNTPDGETFSHGSIPHDPNVAVAIIDEPTFVGKSTILLDFLSKRVSDLTQPSGILTPSQSIPLPSPKLTFLMGTDTIVRLFAPRYYSGEQGMATALRRFLSADGDDSSVICARRINKGVPRADEERAETELPDIVKNGALSHKVSFVEIGEQESIYSSSEVREKRANHILEWRSMVTQRIMNYVTEHGLYLFSP